MGISWIAGLAVFSMFFGAGNLIYPISAGAECGIASYLYSAIGISITAVLMPFLGLVASALTRENNIFLALDRRSSFVLMALILALLGPLGALPRSISVSFSGIHPIAPSLELWEFNLIFTTIMFFLNINQSKIISWIGSVLTPPLYCSIAMVVFYALSTDPPISTEAISISNLDALFVSLVEGYNTMDMIVTPFFVLIVADYLKSKQSYSIANLFKSSAIGVSLLLIVYIAFIYIGAKFSSQLVHVEKEMIFMEIVNISADRWIVVVSGICIILACFTTACALLSLTHSWLKNNIKGLSTKISDVKLTFLLCVISYIVSILGLKTINSFLGVILYQIYPAFIALILFSLFDYFTGKSNKIKIPPISHYAFWIVGSITVIYFIYNNFI